MYVHRHIYMYRCVRVCIYIYLYMQFYEHNVLKADERYSSDANLPYDLLYLWFLVSSSFQNWNNLSPNNI